MNKHDWIPLHRMVKGRIRPLCFNALAGAALMLGRAGIKMNADSPLDKDTDEVSVTQ